MKATVTTIEAATMLGVPEQRIRDWARFGKINPVRPGAKPLLWRWDELVVVHQRTRRDKARLEAARKLFWDVP